MGYYLSRQRDYEDGCLYVEVAVGGKDHAGVDVLAARYQGELKNLVSPLDAINLAEDIYIRWQADNGLETKKLRIVGEKIPLVFEFNKQGLQSAKMWAEKTLAGMTKCGYCNKPMGNRKTYEFDDIPNRTFCSEVCASIRYKDMFGVEAPNLVAKKKSSGSAGLVKTKKTMTP